MKKYKGFAIGETVHFDQVMVNGVCIPDTWGKVVGIDEYYITVSVSEVMGIDESIELIRIHPCNLLHKDEQA